MGPAHPRPGTDGGQAEDHAPAGFGLTCESDLADVEVAQALRGYVREGALDAGSAAAALEDLRSLDLERHGHEPLLDRVWALRDNLTAYDAVYVALAEALECTLLTCDGRLARAPGLSRRVVLVR